MTVEEKKIFEEYLSKALNLDTEGVAALFNEAGELTTVEPLLESFKGMKADHKTALESQYSRGIKEQAIRVEKALKEKYDVDSGAVGIELFEEILDKKINEVKETSTLKPEDVEKNPIFVSKRRELEKQLEKQKAELEEQFKAKEEGIRYEQILLKAKPNAIRLLNELGAVKPEDAGIASEHESVFLDRLTSGFRFATLDGSDELVVLDKEGKAAQDAYGKMISFKDAVESVGRKLFTFRKAEERNNAGNTNTGGSNAIRTQDEFLAAMRNAKTPKEEAEILEKFEGSQK